MRMRFGFGPSMNSRYMMLPSYRQNSKPLSETKRWTLGTQQASVSLLIGKSVESAR